MKHPILSGLILSCSIIPFSCLVAGAQPSNPCGQSWKRPLKEVRGKIIKVYDSNIPGTRMEGRHLRLKTSSGKDVVIHVFPKMCIDNNPSGEFQFTTGDEISVTGSEFFTGPGGSQGNICAAELQYQGHNFTGKDALRDVGTGSINKILCAGKKIPACTRTCQDRCSGKPGMCLNRCMSMCNHNTQMN